MSPRLWWAAWAPMGLLVYLIVNGGGYMGGVYRCTFSCAPYGSSLPMLTQCVMQARSTLLGPWGILALLGAAVLPYSTWLCVRRLRSARCLALGISLALLVPIALCQWTLLLPFQVPSTRMEDPPYVRLLGRYEPRYLRFVLFQSWMPHFIFPMRAGEIPFPKAPPLRRIPVQRLSLLSYNVWESPFRSSERWPALLSLIQESQVDVIALQEVTPPFLKALDSQPWIRDYQQAREGEYLLLSKLPIEKTEYLQLPGRLKRGALLCRLKGACGTLAVGVVHLESFLEDGTVRAKQLDRILPRLADARDAVLMGDFNFGDGEPESSHIDPAYVDVWRELHPSEPGFTWDEEKSALARAGSLPGERSRRLDRILLRSKNAWEPKKIQILGDAPIAQDLFPSDHFALAASLTCYVATQKPQP